MTSIIKLNFISVLCVTIFFYSCNKQVKKDLSKENAIISSVQPKPIKSGSGNVNCSLQDKKGNLWFGTTSQGVYLYDGKSFTNFTTKDGLNSDGILTMYEDKKGDIWFGTDKGISRFNGKTFSPFKISNGNYIDPFSKRQTTYISVNKILEDKNGKFWFASENGIYCYDGKIFRSFLDDPKIIKSNKFEPKFLQNMIEDKNGNMWFTSRAEGIYRFDGRTIDNYRPNNEEWFRGLLEDKNGNIWFGTRYKGVYKYDGKIFIKISQNEKFDSFTVLSIIQDKFGNIWFGTEAGDVAKRNTEGGLWRYDGKTFENISKKDDLSRPGVWCILEDKSGNFWIGTRNTGLSRYDGIIFTSFSE